MKSKNADYNIKSFDAKSFVEAKEVEYKKVDVEDFIHCNYNVETIDIKTDSKGFVTFDLLDKIDITVSSTDVLNIPTGSGKTTAIYQKIKQILEQDKTSVIILATPFIALVKKDLKALVDEYNIDKELITDYREIQKDKKIKSTSFNLISQINKAYIDNKRIHITTINALLGNPGEVAFAQKFQKSSYFTELQQYCTKPKINVYLFFDEIHASIHNFKNVYINNLTIWKGVVHKCIVSTATYTEPVNIVVKHLAYLTRDNIHILECDRIKKPQLSPLDIVFTSEPHSVKSANAVKTIIPKWIKDNLRQNNNFHIISYSKKFAKMLNVYMQGVGISSVLLTSETKKNFNENNNNIGTNFSTGVNIEKEGDLLIIIFPSKYNDELVKGEEGIFYDGLPTILQSMARLRAVGRILLIIPPMNVVINDGAIKNLINRIPYYRAIINEGELKFEKETFLKDEKEDLKRHIHPVNTKYKEESDRYNSDVKNSVVSRPEIQYPNEETFILERGQEYLKYKNNKSGKYITPYVLWAAVHDQFLNCSLDTVYYTHKVVSKLELSKENIIDEICDYVKYSKDIMSSMSFVEYYDKVLAQLFIKTQYDTTSVVRVYLDGNLLNRKQIQTNNTIYFGIVGSYFRQMGYPFTKPDKDSYLTLMLTENILPELESKLDLSYGHYYYILRAIITDFMSEYQNQSYTQGEIIRLPFFNEKVTLQINELHDYLKKEDPILHGLSKIGSFWSVPAEDGVVKLESVIKLFIDYYLELSKPKGKTKQRQIERSVLSKSASIDHNYINRAQVQLTPKSHE